MKNGKVAQPKLSPKEEIAKRMEETGFVDSKVRLYRDKPGGPEIWVDVYSVRAVFEYEVGGHRPCCMIIAKDCPQFTVFRSAREVMVEIADAEERMLRGPEIAFPHRLRRRTRRASK